MSNKIDLAKLRELEAKATPGPWCPAKTAAKAWFQCGAADGPHGADLTLLTEVRNALPDLLAAVEERDRLRAALYQHGHSFDASCSTTMCSPGSRDCPCLFKDGTS